MQENEKTYKTIVEDVNNLLENGLTLEEFKERKGDLDFSISFGVQKQLVKGSQPVGTLRMSNIGSPCTRKLYYQVNFPDHELKESLRGDTKLKFMYGDLTEEMVLALVQLSGHDIVALQGRVEIEGITGTFDAIIDGMLFDVKSTSKYAFKKFKEHTLPDDDAFGYIPQLMSYLFALQNDERLTVKDKAGFLVFNKENGQICIDEYEKVSWFDKIPDLYKKRKEQMASKEVPDRDFHPVPDGKSGNMKLPMFCSYCDYKHLCHPGLRIFVASTGPVYLTQVEREPRMIEVDRFGNSLVNNNE